jgi:HKD family nuclease
MFFAGGPGRPIELGESVQEAVANTSTPCRVRIGFAYVTQGGIPSLCEDNSGSDWRDMASSEWLIGVDQGITEPGALRELSAHKDADVRVLIPSGNLSRDALYKRPRFHAKVALVESTSVNNAASLITTSANLTASALDNLPTNYEIGMMQSTSGGLTSDDIDEFSEWWESAWSRSTPITDDFLAEYEDIREDFLDNNPDIQKYESSTTVTQASEATHLR